VALALIEVAMSLVRLLLLIDRFNRPPPPVILDVLAPVLEVDKDTISEFVTDMVSLFVNAELIDDEAWIFIDSPLNESLLLLLCVPIVLARLPEL